MSQKIRYAVAKLNQKFGKIEEESIQWVEDKPSAAVEKMKKKNDGGLCAVFFYPDVAEIAGDGYFKETMNATREQFEADPCKYGLALYKQPFGVGNWVFE